MVNRSFIVIINKKSLKAISKLPMKVQKKLNLLVKDLRDLGPVLPQWPNYSKLGVNKYHCHLDYRWVACCKMKGE